MITLSLPQAQSLLLQQIVTTVPEIVTLDRALGRVATTAVRARLAVPSFPQSCRDGYALRSRDTAEQGDQAEADEHRAAPHRLTVRGEIAAGRTRPAARLRAGQTYRIMTGGMLPPGADSVIAFEKVAREAQDHILIAGSCPAGAHIRPIGTDLRKNQVVVPAGIAVAPDHLPRLATAGVGELEVAGRPRVGLLCTGSELLDDTGENPAPGSLISGNRFLLAGLIHRAGGEPVDLGTVGDDTTAIAAILDRQAAHGKLAAIISTGGMGPGKYDLVSRALDQLPAEILYHELRLRPGRATMAARIHQTLFFGLPGPPPAVHLLFHLLVVPALRKAQGHRQPRPPLVQAHLSQTLRLRQTGITQLKGGLLSSKNGKLLVRLAAGGEAINCVILVPARRRQFALNELVRVQAVGQIISS